MENENLMTVAEYAKQLRVKRESVYKLIEDGKITATKGGWGNKTRIDILTNPIAKQKEELPTGSYKYRCTVCQQDIDADEKNWAPDGTCCMKCFKAKKHLKPLPPPVTVEVESGLKGGAWV